MQLPTSRYRDSCGPCPKRCLWQFPEELHQQKRRKQGMGETCPILAVYRRRWIRTRMIYKEFA